ncbi:MAG: hypothetical protein HXY41_17170 [Chloroflexi bacterium]|nr:hypothetical protein [Chloroflexota bacterium]
MHENLEEKYLRLLLKRIEICRSYKPRFGLGAKAELSLQQFQQLYNSDPFYQWFGLDNALVYSAHKAAGGITSIYRQIGLGSEELFREILQDWLGLDESQAAWSYSIEMDSGKIRTLKLDGRIPLADIQSIQKRERITQWLRQAAAQLGIAPELTSVLKGAVFEVRQGYKSKDSKRQNADIANAVSAYTQGYLPVVVVFSTQIDTDVAARYERQRPAAKAAGLSLTHSHEVEHGSL